MTQTVLPKCLENAREVSLVTDSKVFEPGDVCHHFYYVLSGIIRVDLITRSGKPLTLYRLGDNETCILTTSCLLSGDHYNAQAVAEQPVTALAIPRDVFFSQLDQSPEFRQFVFSSFASRLSAMMEKIEEVTSIPIEQRLAIRTLELYEERNPIVVTHEQLAADLGTAREVVSRKLANWENYGWIKRQRGSFTILDTQPIQQLARHAKAN